VIAAALLAGVLVQIRPQPSPGVVQAGDKYGEVREGPLDDVARENGNYQKAHVRTRGRLGMVSGYYSLTDGGAQLLLLLGHGLDVNEVQRRLGSEIEARGIVRRIRTKEYVNGVDKDLIEDRDLPVLPAPHVSLPRVSLTLLGFSEIEFTGRRDADRMSQRAPFEAILADPGRFADKPIKVIGQFRGRNLYGDLPEGSERTPKDWVVKDGEHAVWVTGKEPKGKGFTLDASYKGDTSRWLEVEGKPEVVNGVLYLRASKVDLAQRRPKEEQQ
jgi:hypothetical protein